MDNKKDDIPNISGYTIASVLTQFLALMFFFLAIVAFVNDSVIGGVILVAIGVLCEFLFVKMIKKILFWKKQEKEGVSQPAEEAFAESLYRNDGESYETARRLYCEQHGKKAGKLTGEDDNMIWQYTYGDFAYLLMWVIDNGFYRPSKDYDEDQAEEAKAEIAKIRKREALPTDFLSDYSDGFFMEDEVAKKARGFVKAYRDGSFLDDVRAFAKDKLGTELYGFPFRWEDYDAFKPKIDEAYKKYQEKNSAADN
jgi:hypothetical protein